MQALHDVVQLGWVRYVGMSSCHAYQFQAMQSGSRLMEDRRADEKTTPSTTS